MQSTFVLCVLIVLLGAASAVVDAGDENVIIRKPQTVEARQIEHGDDDHDHEEDHVEQDSHNANSTGDVFNNATKTSSTPDAFHNANENSTRAFEDEDYHTSEVPEVDDSGCQLRMRNQLERKCFIKFEDSVARSLHIETEEKQEKEVCCALEEYEKCCYRGYKETNCNTDKESLKETLKAARIFLGAITKNSCSAHRGRCSLSSTAIPEVDDSGCQLRIRDELERKCFMKFEGSVDLHIETEAEQEKVCCALDEYEKCCYRGYKATNCSTESLKENLKAARIFLRAITKNSCSAYRGRCQLSSAARIGTTRETDLPVSPVKFTLHYNLAYFAFLFVGLLLLLTVLQM